MPTTLSTRAAEEGTFILTVAFTDEDGDAIIPDTITWTLSTENGSVINSRSAVSIAVPAASVDIVLRGDDLAFQTGESGTAARYLTVKATYDSTAGLDLPLNDHAVFYITDIKSVS